LIVQGLVINRFQEGIRFDEGSSGAVVAGNFIGTDPDGASSLGNSTGILIFRSSGNTIGGQAAEARNVISGNGSSGIAHIDGVDNVIQGNYIGTNSAGTVGLGNGAGIDIGGDNATALIGGTTADARNVISGNAGPGIAVNVGPNNVIQGNYIGTDATGTAAIANAVGITGGGAGIGALNIRIGGTEVGAGNLISGNTGNGVNLAFGANALIAGNLIGTQQDGISALGNGADGVGLGFTTGGAFGGGPDTVGGTTPGAGNVIAFNSGTGVRAIVGFFGGTGGAGQGQHTILGNSIFSNGQLGIDLGLLAGVTLNDEGDADEGVNHQQNFPVITSVTRSGGNITIAGTLNSEANSPYRIEFFTNPAVDPSGFGEGQTFTGFVDLTTDASGNAAFNETFPEIGTIQSVTSTATNTDRGETSEFSAAFTTKLLNISTRMQVLTDDNVLIGGFIVTGISPKRVIVRAIGPALTGSGVAGALMDPTLELNSFDGSITTNDDWKDDQQAEIEATGLQPTQDAESAIVQTLAPGAYTAIVRGAGGTTGIGLVEAYDLDQLADSKLANISTRGFVDTADNVMIGGFIIGPEGLGDATVLVRAIGPSLENSGVANALQDPTLELFDGNGALLTSNDDWKDDQQGEIEATQLEPTDDRESAILSTLAPGGYTAIVRGVADTTGVGLVEVYHLQ
ncbi:MAG: right-handed parallel beta-helix repeat-containing protein, partial [Verrucomicrobiota bacterium]|nr:right-handed parallel beta-helix repeat-containing protein [Verrucomicrobiota bacterium]